MARHAFLALLLAGHALANASEPAPTASGWSLRLPAQERVVFRGQVSFDKAGQGPGTMMYPAPGLAGFLVAIATHAAISSSVRDGQRTEIEIAADKVLQPYQETLDGFRYGELAGLALPPEAGLPILPVDAKPQPGLIISSAPVFYMTQDQSALILDNTVSVFKTEGDEKPVYTNTVRVVSHASEVPDLVAHWKQDAGKRLREESARLFRQSVEIVRTHAMAPAGSASAAQRTFRYLEGQREAIERAEPLAEHCGRALVKNLRGWLLSIPLKRPAEAAPGCEAVGEKQVL